MNSFWKDKNVLITGHTGFKGSWLSLMLKFFDAKIFGISLEPKNGIYELSSVSSILDKEMFVDLSDFNLNIAKELKEFNPEFVFHFAAQSLVIDGYKKPLETVMFNVNAPVNLIENLHKSIDKTTLIVATTDKVYKNPSLRNIETDELGGYDFYSSSKVSKEMIIEAYKNHPNYNNFHFNKVRSGNVIGGGERAENRLFTDLINSNLNMKPIILRNPTHIRPWQYILDSLNGYLLVAMNSYKNNTSETYNLNSELNNNYTVKDIAELFNKYSEFEQEVIIQKNISFKEVDELRINSSKAEKDLQWYAKIMMPEIVENIIKWEKFHKLSRTPDFSLSEIEFFLSN